MQKEQKYILGYSKYADDEALSRFGDFAFLRGDTLIVFECGTAVVVKGKNTCEALKAKEDAGETVKFHSATTDASLVSAGMFQACPQTEEKFSGFADCAYYAFPQHRYPVAKIPEILKQNEHNWQWSQTLPDASLIAEAYDILIKDCYPYPGTPRADKEVWLDEEMIVCYYPHRDRRIINFQFIFDPECVPLARDTKVLNYITAASSDHRRYDYMFPSVRAIIEEDGTIRNY